MSASSSHFNRKLFSREDVKRSARFEWSRGLDSQRISLERQRRTKGSTDYGNNWQESRHVYRTAMVRKRTDRPRVWLIALGIPCHIGVGRTESSYDVKLANRDQSSNVEAVEASVVPCAVRLGCGESLAAGCVTVVNRNAGAPRGIGQKGMADWKA